MRLASLDHYTIRTTDLAAARRFYVELLGMSEGERPPFPFPGAWLYVGDQPVVHLIGIDPQDAAGLTGYLGERDSGATRGTGALDHVAFRAEGAAALRARLQSREVPFRQRRVPLLGLYQIFVTDPTGVTIELNYAAEETPPELL